MAIHGTASTVLVDESFDPSSEVAWEQFDRQYRPTVLGFAARLGLNDADAADVAQETMLEFVKEYRDGRYDPSRGRLQAWLVALAKSKVALFRRAHRRRVRWHPESALNDLSDRQSLFEVSDAQRFHHLLGDALEALRRHSRFSARSLDAFELLVIRHTPPAAVADQIGMTLHDVYLAKSRIAKRLRSILAGLEACQNDTAPARSNGQHKFRHRTCEFEKYPRS